jgi:hypothetical protein
MESLVACPLTWHIASEAAKSHVLGAQARTEHNSRLTGGGLRYTEVVRSYNGGA